MKEFILLLFTVVIWNNLIAQQVDDSSKVIEFTVSTVRTNMTDEWEEKVKLYSDSLNYHSNGDLPRFIFDECFEVSLGISKAYDNSDAIRWAILEKVNNKATLKKIIKSKDKAFDKKCSIKMVFDNPIYKASYRELVRKRLKQLR